MRAMDGDGQSFRTLLEENQEVMSRIGSKVKEVFDDGPGLEHTDLAYESLGWGVKTNDAGPESWTRPALSCTRAARFATRTSLARPAFLMVATDRISASTTTCPRHPGPGKV